jgi:DNA-directed RNA polymerase specialized sigma24 family protein
MSITETTPHGDRGLELLELLRCGDKEATDTVRGWIYRQCLAKLGNPQDAADVTQNVLITLLEKPPLDENSNLRAWLHTVTDRAIIDLHRNRKRRREVPLPEGFEIPAPVHDSGSDAVLDTPARQQVLHDALVRLEDEHRVVNLARLKELRITDQDPAGLKLAAEAGLELRVVGSRKSQATTFLRKSVSVRHLLNELVDGHFGCDGLREMLNNGGWNGKGEIIPLWRKRILKHAKTCRQCGPILQGVRRHYALPLPLFIPWHRLRDVIHGRRKLTAASSPVPKPSRASSTAAAPSSPVTPSIPIGPGTSSLPKAASAVVHAVVHNKVTAAIIAGALVVTPTAGLIFLPKPPNVQASPPYSGPATTIDPAPSGAASGPSGPPSATLSSPPPGQGSTNPTPINGNIPPPSTGGTSNPPSTIPISPTVTPPLMPPPARTQPSNDSPPPATYPYVPAYQYTAAPNLAGAWSMTFTRTSGAMKNAVEHYTITLKSVDSSKCASASPCYSGRWTNVDAHNEEAAEFTATVSLSEDVIKFSGIETDYAQKGPQHYEGTAPNDTRIKTIKFTGSWRQSSPSDGDQTATFTLTRK